MFAERGILQNEYENVFFRLTLVYLEPFCSIGQYVKFTSSAFNQVLIHLCIIMFD